MSWFAKLRRRGRERTRAVRRFFESMPTSSKALFSAGVFCCFAPIGLLHDLPRLGYTPGYELIAWAAFSGAVAVGYVWSVLLDRRWFPVVVFVQVVGTFGIARLLPPVVVPEALDAAATEAARERLLTVAIAAIGIMVMAYLTFVVLLQQEGRRFGRVHAEIQLAREIHTALVPPLSNQRAGLEWRGSSKPSGDVGGDLVDVLPDAPGGWLACVADVSGHGVGAGLLMGMFKTALHAHARSALDLGAMIARIHETLHPLKRSGMYITCAILRRIATDRFEYVLAGHPSFLHVDGRTGRTRWVGAPQLAVGLVDSSTFTSHYLDVRSGDVLLLVTDGLLEVFDRHDRELGKDGLERAVAAAGPASLAALERAVFEACARHGAQLDDQTLLLIRM